MKKIFEWFKNLFSSGLKKFLAAVFTEAKTQVIDALKDVAMVAVTKLADTELSNEDKRKAAFSEIKAYAKAKGMAVKDSIINLVLEMAVSAIKG